MKQLLLIYFYHNDIISQCQSLFLANIYILSKLYTYNFDACKFILKKFFD